MGEEMKITAIGAFLYGALYLVAVFVAGLAYGSHAAVYLAAASAGASYVAQIVIAFRIAGALGRGSELVAWSAAIILAALAGVSLVIGA